MGPQRQMDQRENLTIGWANCVSNQLCVEDNLVITKRKGLLDAPQRERLMKFHPETF